nr:hypothetical protein Itr_chr05CG25030 [Ipomoea trifida]
MASHKLDSNFNIGRLSGGQCHRHSENSKAQLVPIEDSTPPLGERTLESLRTIIASPARFR